MPSNNCQLSGTLDSMNWNVPALLMFGEKRSHRGRYLIPSHQYAHSMYMVTEIFSPNTVNVVKNHLDGDLHLFITFHNPFQQKIIKIHYKVTWEVRPPIKIPENGLTSPFFPWLFQRCTLLRNQIPHKKGNKRYPWAERKTAEKLRASKCCAEKARF